MCLQQPEWRHQINHVTHDVTGSTAATREFVSGNDFLIETSRSLSVRSICLSITKPLATCWVGYSICWINNWRPWSDCDKFNPTSMHWSLDSLRSTVRHRLVNYRIQWTVLIASLAFKVYNNIVLLYDLIHNTMTANEMSSQFLLYSWFRSNIHQGCCLFCLCQSLLLIRIPYVKVAGWVGPSGCCGLS